MNLWENYYSNRDELKRIIVKEIGNINHLYCPTCISLLAHETRGGRKYVTKRNYCHQCGQKLDWSEDNA
jgi:hypothetical protein